MNNLVMPSMGIAGGVLTTSSGFSSASVNGLEFWFKSDSLSLNDNDPVSTWDDNSGLGNSPSQTLTARPTYKTNIANSLPGILFDGVDDVLQKTTGITGLTSNSFTFFAVTKAQGLGVRTMALIGVIGGGRQIDYQYPASTDQIELRKSNTVIIGQASTAFPPNTVHLAGVTYDATTARFYGDGADFGSAVSAQTFANGELHIGGKTTAELYQGYLFELLFYNSVLSTTDRQTVENYLKTKWGI